MIVLCRCTYGTLPLKNLVFPHSKVCLSVCLSVKQKGFFPLQEVPTILDKQAAADKERYDSELAAYNSQFERKLQQMSGKEAQRG